jgi:DNA mismatch repair protein MutS
MNFSSILFEKGDGQLAVKQPEFFRDLNLDQVVTAVVAGRQEYNLAPFFYTPLRTSDAVSYRHEILRDLEGIDLFDAVKSFATQMRSVREHLAIVGKRSYKQEKEAWFLDAVETYGDSVTELLHRLKEGEPKARGFLAFRIYLTQYVAASNFQSRRAEAQKLRTGLNAIRYSLLINGSSVTVRNYEGESDYSQQVEETFTRFKQFPVEDYRQKFSDSGELNHIEAMILERVAQLNRDVFSALEQFCEKHKDFLDPTIVRFDREVQFYLSWLEYISRFEPAGLRFCYPRVSASRKEVMSRAGFDLALATKLAGEKAAVVCNDFSLTGNERILVVTGPNQGGKTTFARTFGQLHFLASLGLTVPGAEAQLFLCDRLFTHFEREEDVTNLRGKLEDDLTRIHRILGEATGDSIIVINEIFSSTTMQDAVYLSKQIVEAIAQLSALALCVTFLDEIASLNERTVSMVASVAPDNPTLRTYKVVRKPAEGVSYALAIADKYRLTYGKLKERVTL